MEQNNEQNTEMIGADQVEDNTNIFASYYKPLAQRTRRRQWRELASLRAFLLDQGLQLGNLATDVSSWSRIKADLIWAYVRHLKDLHYTASSITMQLYTIKTYARLAMEDGKLPLNEYTQIQNMRVSFGMEEGLRRGEKRGQRLDLTPEQVQQLLEQPDTPRGRRDKLLLALLLLCGFWPREIAALDRHSINIKTGEITFYDYNAEEQHTISLDPTTLEAAKNYLKMPSTHEALFLGNQKESTHTLRLTDRAINDRVRVLGEKIHLEALAPQDCHAYWEKYVREKQQQPQSQSPELIILDEAHSFLSQNPPKRKQRPDIYNRRAFEESMRQKGVPDSMLAPFVSESRLIFPWAIEFICQEDSRKQAFLQYMQQKLLAFDLKQNNASFLEEALNLLAAWMYNELQKYGDSRKARE